MRNSGSVFALLAFAYELLELMFVESVCRWCWCFVSLVYGTWN